MSKERVENLKKGIDTTGETGKNELEDIMKTQKIEFTDVFEGWFSCGGARHYAGCQEQQISNSADRGFQHGSTPLFCGLAFKPTGFNPAGLNWTILSLPVQGLHVAPGHGLGSHGLGRSLDMEGHVTSGGGGEPGGAEHSAVLPGSGIIAPVGGGLVVERRAGGAGKARYG